METTKTVDSKAAAARCREAAAEARAEAERALAVAKHFEEQAAKWDADAALEHYGIRL